MKQKDGFKILGEILEEGSRKGIQGLTVEALDKDLLVDDRLGTAVTDTKGRFKLTYYEKDFKELFLEGRPDLYLRVSNSDGKIVFTSEDKVRYEAGDVENFSIYLPKADYSGEEDEPGLEEPPYIPIPDPEELRDYEFPKETDEVLPCCYPKVNVLVKSECKTVPVGREFDIKEIIGLNTVTNLALAPSRVPAANSDASAENSLEQKLLIPMQSVLLIKSYEITVSAIGGCAPYHYKIFTDGDVKSRHECLKQSDTVRVAATELHEDYSRRNRSGLGYCVVAIDCSGRISACKGVIPGA